MWLTFKSGRNTVTAMYCIVLIVRSALTIKDQVLGVILGNPVFGVLECYLTCHLGSRPLPS